MGLRGGAKYHRDLNGERSLGIRNSSKNTPGLLVKNSDAVEVVKATFYFAYLSKLRLFATAVEGLPLVSLYFDFSRWDARRC